MLHSDGDFAILKHMFLTTASTRRYREGCLPEIFRCGTPSSVLVRKQQVVIISRYRWAVSRLAKGKSTGNP